MTPVDSCVFCDIVRGERDATVIQESETHLCFLDAHPVTEGHALVVPKRHVEDLTAIDWEQTAGALQLAHKAIVDRYDPDGTNIGINNGRAAGQTIDHLHWHVIPRYEGDIEDPTGGVRGVIPEKRVY